MKHVFMFLIAGLLAVAPAKGQLGKEMMAFRDRQGVSVTLLNPSTYSLYKKGGVGRLAGDVLEPLKEINVLHVDRQSADARVGREVEQRFTSILGDEARYTLLDGQQDANGQERLFTRGEGERVNTLVLWCEDAWEIVVVELKGEIIPGKVYFLPGILNVTGIEQLARVVATGDGQLALASSRATRPREVPGRTPLDSLFAGGGDPFARIAELFGGTGDPFGDAGGMFGNVEEMIEKMFEGFGEFGQPGTGDVTRESSSRSMRVIRENGKTRIEVEATNVEVLYLVDGKVFPADSVPSLPAELASVDMLDAPDDPRKAYVVVNTYLPAGHFTGYENGVLRYRFENQDYTCNVERLARPALLVNGRLTHDFLLDPSSIVQIRPVSDLERALLSCPPAQVIIITR